LSSVATFFATTRAYGSAIPIAVRATQLSLLVFATVVIGAAFAGCKPPIATPQECDQVANHLADAQVAKEKIPPLGKLSSKPFDDADHEKELREEVRSQVKSRCDKGWKRDVWDCMMKATDLETADKCRSL
jgi:hypothetical protein